MERILKITDFSKKLSLKILKNEQYSIILNDEEDVDRNFSIEIDVIWDNANLSLKWRVLTESNKTKLFSINIKVLWENQKIDLDLKWIVSCEGLLDFVWLWVIWKSSKWANVKICERILLFWKKAKGKALPVLRVESSDLGNVSHSAVIAPIDKDQLFYLETRAIGEKEAIRLIKDGFFKVK